MRRASVHPSSMPQLGNLAEDPSGSASSLTRRGSVHPNALPSTDPPKRKSLALGRLQHAALAMAEEANPAPAFSGRRDSVAPPEMRGRRDSVRPSFASRLRDSGALGDRDGSPDTDDGSPGSRRAGRRAGRQCAAAHGPSHFQMLRPNLFSILVTATRAPHIGTASSSPPRGAP